jgi:hypothetical protein
VKEDEESTKGFEPPEWNILCSSVHSPHHSPAGSLVTKSLEYSSLRLGATPARTSQTRSALLPHHITHSMLKDCIFAVIYEDGTQQKIRVTEFLMRATVSNGTLVTQTRAPACTNTLYRTH